MKLHVLWQKHKALATLVSEWRQADQRALDLKAELYDERHKIISNALAELRRLVYIGVGVMLAVQLAVLVWKK